MYKKLNSRKKLLKAVKIALGSSMAIFMAKTFHLDYAISAGTITLLTVVTTKWETIRLSLYRLVTLLLTIFLAGVLFFHISNEWVAYGIFVFILVMVCEMFGWGATISVNSVIGAHFLGKALCIVYTGCFFVLKNKWGRDVIVIVANTKKHYICF